MKRWKQILVILAVVCLTWSVAWAVVTYKYVYPAETVQASTDEYGGATADLDNDNAYDLTGAIDMETNGYYGCWISCEATEIAGSGADNTTWSIFASYDGTAFDTVPLYSVTMTNTQGADMMTFLLYPCPPRFKIGVKTTGTTDSFDYQITTLPARGVDDSS